MHLTVGAVVILLFADTVTAQNEDADTAEESISEDSTKTCTYTTYAWSLKKKGPVDHRNIKKSYDDVTDAERDPRDPRCTVCSEDQSVIDLASFGFEGPKSIKICRHYKDAIENALKEIAADGTFRIVGAKGYLVGKTRGPVVEGKRTKFSNHSFGTAIDINAKYNGLYSRCNIDTLSVKALKTCRLTDGGPWNPKKFPKYTITQGGVVYRAITSQTSWRWGGENPGKLKDLMHFSITGH